ncbi:hypothetical protein [Actinomadura rugatobispora]|uniref:Tyr recombinase domain-containing protein n=1 Tax=Actinomadura rugatobispora TaxID=1994 RepID=A0ABW1A1B8_9ACTN
MSKTVQDAQGEVVAIPRGGHPLTAPVAAWAACLAERGITTGRLLRSVDRHGRWAPNSLVVLGLHRAVDRLTLSQVMTQHVDTKLGTKEEAWRRTPCRALGRGRWTSDTRRPGC